MQLNLPKLSYFCEKDAFALGTINYAQNVAYLLNFELITSLEVAGGSAKIV